MLNFKLKDGKSDSPSNQRPMKRYEKNCDLCHGF